MTPQLSTKIHNTNQDLLTLPALLLYFHDIFVTAKQFHNVNLKNDALCKTYAAVFTLIVQTYIFCQSNQIIYLTPTPRGTNYYLHKWEVTCDHVQHM